MENKVYFYTKECSLCNHAFPSFIEGKIRKFFVDNNKNLIIKQISLFDGWRIEATNILSNTNKEIPFFFYKGNILELKDSYNNNQLNINNLNNLLKI